MGDSESDGVEVQLGLGVVNSAGMRVGLQPRKVNPKLVDDSGGRTGIDVWERSWPAESRDVNCSSVSQQESVQGKGIVIFYCQIAELQCFVCLSKMKYFQFLRIHTRSVMVHQGEFLYRRVLKQLIGL